MNLKKMLGIFILVMLASEGWKWGKHFYLTDTVFRDAMLCLGFFIGTVCAITVIGLFAHFIIWLFTSD